MKIDNWKDNELESYEINYLEHFNPLEYSQKFKQEARNSF